MKKNSILISFIFIFISTDIYAVKKNESLKKASAVPAFLKEENPYQTITEQVDSRFLRVRKDIPLNSLSVQKRHEFEKKWNECSAVASSNFTNFKDLRAWILASWLRCARMIESDKESISALKKALAQFEKNQLLLLKPNSGEPLRMEVIRSRLGLVEKMMKVQAPGVTAQIESLFQWENSLDKAQKAKLYFMLSELAQYKGDLSAALQMAQNSLNEVDQKSTREKISSLYFALTASREEKKEDEAIGDAEGEFEERFKQSQRQKDAIAFLTDAIAYLKAYPAGRRSKWANDRALELYNQLFDQLTTASGPKLEVLASTREKALQILEHADAFRLSEWAKSLHRRLDLEAGLRLSEKALEKFESQGSLGASAATLYYIAGRSAQMLGDYKKAKKYFEVLIDQFAGSEEFMESLFRLGLVHLRMGQANSAIANFERLLTLKGVDRWELNTRYWLARSYQATNNLKALSLIDDLISRYTFSYYGLRLRMERSSGLLEWPAPLLFEKKVESKWTVLNSHTEALRRAEKLVEQGWLQESMLEIQSIPSPRDPEARLALAKKLSDWGIFPRAIRLINELTEQNQDYKTWDIISLALPEAYGNLIVENSSKNKLHPILVKSLIRQESAFGPRAQSTSNALGLMQIIPPTAQEIAGELGLQKIEIPDDMHFPDLNIQMGSYYLAKVIIQFGGHVPMGLAAYNAGPQRVRIFVSARKEVEEQMQNYSSDPLDEMWFDELPWMETSFYVKAILRNTIMYRLSEVSRPSDPMKMRDRKVQFESVLWSKLSQIENK
jgi:soluble lytic murein transglycosylase